MSVTIHRQALRKDTYGWGQLLHQRRCHDQLGIQKQGKPQVGYQKPGRQSQSNLPGRCGRDQPSDQLRGCQFDRGCSWYWYRREGMSRRELIISQVNPGAPSYKKGLVRTDTIILVGGRVARWECSISQETTRTGGLEASNSRYVNGSFSEETGLRLTQLCTCSGQPFHQLEEHSSWRFAGSC